MSSTTQAGPAVNYEPPMTAAARGVLAEWRSTRDPRTWPEPPAGAGRPVLLVPGFLAGDPSLTRLASWLRSGEFRTYRSGIAINVACMEELVESLERRLESIVERNGAPAVLVGQSRGGVLCWVLSVRRPELVEHLVTLGSPVRDPMAVFRRQWLGIGLVGLLGTLGVPGCFSLSCRRGTCCERARAQLHEPLPTAIRCTAVYSRNDEVVRWQACLAPGAEQIEVRGSHIGMGVDAEVWQRLSHCL